MSNATVHPLIIIGSGPAGLTAAIYAARAFLKPLVFQGIKPGGQLMGTSFIENWPGTKSIMGPELMINMQEQAVNLGAQLIDQTITNVDFSQRPFTLTTSNGITYQSHAVIIATGSSVNKLGCPGEQDYFGKGVATCAVCDGAFYPNKKVVIVGGGDTAMETASFMAKYTSHITIVHILNKLTASATMQHRVITNPAINIIYNSTITTITGNGSHVTHVTVHNQGTKESTILEADVVFLAIGSKPNTTPFQGQLDLDRFGCITVHSGTKTSVEGVFAAGDVTDFKYKQAIVSAGNGCMAALDAQRYLEHQGLV